jgi:alpha-galactosidase
MPTKTPAVGLLLAIAIVATHALAVPPVHDDETQWQDQWVRENLLAAPAGSGAAAKIPLPFSFQYGGKSSAVLLPAWERKLETVKLDENRTRQVLTWTDPATHLSVRCEAVEYHDFPTVEWTLWFVNGGQQDSPALSDVQAIDTRCALPAGGCLLRWPNGSRAAKEDFQPHATELAAGQTVRQAPNGGRPTDGVMPYWNLQWADRGVIAVLGWPGQWAAAFARDAAGLRLRAGLEQFNAVLRPGEQVRSPLALLQFWTGGDWIRSQNVWRRFYIGHVIPRPGGKVPQPFTATCVDDAFPGMLSNATSVIRSMDIYAAGGHKFDYWWTDAGWYATDKDWYNGAGTWEPDPKRYPKGLKEITDHAHKLGMKHVVWFEPERVAPGSWLARNRPEWLLGGAGGMRLLDLGNEAARHWLTDHIDKLLVEQGIDLYRQDFNIEPLGFWRGSDAAGRTGMTEMKYVMGLLAYWDELRRRHPDMLIDTCASGGRRLDLETLRRAVPLLRTDYRFEPVGSQGQMYGLSLWVTFHGSGVYQDAPYIMRTHMNACFGYGANVPSQKPDFPLLARMDRQWRQVADLFVLGDFYPLAEYSLANDVWMAWQFDRPEQGRGAVQIFRRAESKQDSARFLLRGLDPAAPYEVVNLDGGRQTADGRALMTQGLAVELRGAPDSAIFTYRRSR